MKRLYIILCALGLLVPYAFFLPWLFSNGPDLPLFARQMFANQIASFFTADVIVSSLALWAFIYHEHGKRPVRGWWLSVLANLTVGVSLALPLFLLLREMAHENT